MYQRPCESIRSYVNDGMRVNKLILLRTHKFESKVVLAMVILSTSVTSKIYEKLRKWVKSIAHYMGMNTGGTLVGGSGVYEAQQAQRPPPPPAHNCRA